jgi:redox-sensing transcriptional repressor
MSIAPKPPFPTIERLALYTRALEALLAAGVQVASSEALAKMCGVNPAQVRKDLAYFGDFGTRGVGYDVQDLLKATKGILATETRWRLCIVGMGNLGKAILENQGFKKRGYEFLMAFDTDPTRVGQRIGGLEVMYYEAIPEKIKECPVDIGVIATRATDARKALKVMAQAGIRGILNFSPVQLKPPEGVILENVDISVRFERLAYTLEKELKNPLTKPQGGS